MRQEVATKGEVDAVTTCVCSAVAALHAAGVAHRDLKPQQFCFKARGPGLQVKLIDFDLAANFKDPAPLPPLQGLTPAFAPPEALLGESLLLGGAPLGEAPPALGPEADVYAVGLVLAQLRHPHRRPVFATDAQARDLPSRPQALALALAALSAEEALLLGAMLAEAPDTRPRMPAVLLDPLVSAGKDSLVRSVKAERGRADQAGQLRGQLRELQDGLELLGLKVETEAMGAAEDVKLAMAKGNAEVVGALKE